MERVRLWEGSPCPLCESQGKNSKLKFFRLNLRVSALLCKQIKCPFPLTTNYADTFVRLGRDGKIIPGSQSEIGWPDEGEDDSDDSPYISDASEESVTFPDFIPELKKPHKVSSQNKNEARSLEVDAFDINSIDFETDDSMDTFKLWNEISSLEMEIARSVENMKSAPSHSNYEGSSVLDSNNKKVETSGSVAAKSSTGSNSIVCANTQKALDITNNSCVEMNENGVGMSNNIASGNTISSLEMEIARSVENMKSAPSHNNCKGSSVLDRNNKKVETSGSVTAKSSTGSNSIVCANTQRALDITDNSCVDMNENGMGMSNNIASGNTILCGHSLATTIPESSEITNISEELANCTKPSEVKTPVSNKSVTNHKPSNIQSNSNSNCHNDDSGAGDDDSSGNRIDGGRTNSDGSNSSCRDNNVGKQLDTISTAETTNLEPEISLLDTHGVNNIVENSVPKNCQLDAELFTSDSVNVNIEKDNSEVKCDNTEVDVIFDDYVNSSIYEIVTIDDDASFITIPDDSKGYEVINLELNFCEDQKSSKDVVEKKIAEAHPSAQNSSKEHDMKINVTSANSKSTTPSVKLKIIEESGKYVCTTSDVSSNFSEVKRTKQLQNKNQRGKIHSNNCVCFLCTETNKKGITTHLDRALADLFTEEHPVEKQLSARELPTEMEIINDFVHYLTGHGRQQNIKKRSTKRKRLFHL